MPLVRKQGQPAAGSDAESSVSAPSLASGNSDDRWAAARLLATRPEGARALAAALANEPDKRVRQALFSGLATIASDESIDALVSFLRSDDAQLRTGALDALRVTGPFIEAHLPRLFQDPDADVRLLACELARGLPGAQGSQLLCALLDDEPEPNVCASALEVLAEVGDATALPTLARCSLRFRGTPFMEFAIRHTIERIGAQPDGTS